MKKIKLYTIISILITLIFFSTSAICSQCGTTSTPEAPKIKKLEIYDVPTHSQADDICHYRVKAIVTGSPTPKVTFSRDDSNGAWGSNEVQINLNKDASYTLKVVATNSEGEATMYTFLSNLPPTP